LYYCILLTFYSKLIHTFFLSLVQMDTHSIDVAHVSIIVNCVVKFLDIVTGIRDNNVNDYLLFWTIKGFLSFRCFAIFV